MTQKTIYLCPTCGQHYLTVHDSELRCQSGHTFPFFTKSKVPIFACDQAGRNEFNLGNAAEIHDNALKWLFDTFSVDEAALRRSMLAKLNLTKGQTVLITSAGAGNDLPYLAELVGKEGVIYAQDFAAPMLMSAVDRCHQLYGLQDHTIEFSISDATHLPFADDTFDAAYHFGGLNLFSNMKKGFSEMDRVVKPGGKVVVGDEGIAPWLKETDYAKWLINNNQLYRCEAPLHLIPELARDVHVSWVIGNCFYLVDYTVSRNPLEIDINIPHVGKRGGSIKTRYFGQLEGIDPELKTRLYAESEKRGVSRVNLIEQFIKRGLADG